MSVAGQLALAAGRARGRAPGGARRRLPRSLRADRAEPRAALCAARRACISSTTAGRVHLRPFVYALADDATATGRYHEDRSQRVPGPLLRPELRRARRLGRSDGACSAWTSPRASSCSARTASAGTSSPGCCTARASRSSRACSPTALSLGLGWVLGTAGRVLRRLGGHRPHEGGRRCSWPCPGCTSSSRCAPCCPCTSPRPRPSSCSCSSSASWTGRGRRASCAASCSARASATTCSRRAASARATCT